MQTLPQRLVQLAREMPDATACWSKVRGLWRRTSWRDGAGRMLAGALTMARCGVGTEDRVLVLGDSEPDLNWATLAVLSLGGVAVPVDPAAGASQLRATLDAAGARYAVLRDDEQAAKLVDALAGGSLPRFAWSWRDDASPQVRGLAVLPLLPAGWERENYSGTEALVQAQEASAQAFIGTTHAQLWAAGHALQLRAGVSAGQRMFCAVPLAYEQAQIAWALSLAVPLAGCFAESPDQFEPTLQELQPEVSVLDAAYWDEVVATLPERTRAGMLPIATSNHGGRLAEWLVRRPLRSRLGLRHAVAVLSCGPQDGRAQALLRSLSVRWIAVDEGSALAPAPLPAGTPIPLTTEGTCA
jgi:long-subunit acyl-CoA synthetase (AMP-forming)